MLDDRQYAQVNRTDTRSGSKNVLHIETGSLDEIKEKLNKNDVMSRALLDNWALRALPGDFTVVDGRMFLRMQDISGQINPETAKE